MSNKEPENAEKYSVGVDGKYNACEDHLTRCMRDVTDKQTANRAL